MTTPKPAHREFWLQTGEYCENCKGSDTIFETPNSGIHVIEFSRVLELEQENAELRLEIDTRAKPMVEKLKAENAQLKAELEKAKSNELTNAVFAADEKLREELTQARAEKEKFKTLLGEARSRIGIFIAQSKSNTLEKRWLNDHLKTAQKDIEKLKALIKLNAENGKADRLFENNRKLVAELEAVQEELKLLNEQYAACCAECQGESEENFHLRKERDELLKERAAYRTLNSLMADNAEVCELHDDIEALEAKLAEKDAQREKHNQELSD